MSDQGEALKFGDPVMNIAASSDNPIKYGMFRRRIGRDVEYMTNDGRSHRTPSDNIAKSEISPADEIASLRAKLESARRSLTDIVNETSLGVSITIAVHALAALTDEKST